MQYPSTISRRRSGASKINRYDNVLPFQRSIAVLERCIRFICLWRPSIHSSQTRPSFRQTLPDDYYRYHQLDDANRILHANGRIRVKALLQRCEPVRRMQVEKLIVAQ